MIYSTARPNHVTNIKRLHCLTKLGNFLSGLLNAQIMNLEFSWTFLCKFMRSTLLLKVTSHEHYKKTFPLEGNNKCIPRFMEIARGSRGDTGTERRQTNLQGPMSLHAVTSQMYMWRVIFKLLCMLLEWLYHISADCSSCKCCCTVCVQQTSISDCLFVRFISGLQHTHTWMCCCCVSGVTALCWESDRCVSVCSLRDITPWKRRGNLGVCLQVMFTSLLIAAGAHQYFSLLQIHLTYKWILSHYTAPSAQPQTLLKMLCDHDQLKLLIYTYKGKNYPWHEEKQTNRKLMS